MLSRRLAAQALLAASIAPPLRTPAATPPPPAPLAAVAGGFLIPSSQYSTYCRKLDDLGCAALSYTDASTLTSPLPIADGAASLLVNLKAATERVHLRDYAGLRVGVDASCWLHKGTYSCSEDLCKGRSNMAYVRYCMHNIKILLQYNLLRQ